MQSRFNFDEDDFEWNIFEHVKNEKVHDICKSWRNSEKFNSNSDDAAFRLRVVERIGEVDAENAFVEGRLAAATKIVI